MGREDPKYQQFSIIDIIFPRNYIPDLKFTN